jgi:hypothetical protein
MFARAPQSPDSDERDVAHLFELVAANRRGPVPATALERTRASLAALRAEVGTAAWRAGLEAALRAAARDREPLNGNVATFVADVARRAAYDGDRAEPDAAAGSVPFQPTTNADGEPRLCLGAVIGSDADPYSAPLTDTESDLLLGPVTAPRL